MKTYLVTGAAGFIGANYLKYILNKHKDIFVVVLDKLTYAGNLKNIENELKDKRVEFVKGDICNNELVENIFSRYDIDYVVNFQQNLMLTEVLKIQNFSLKQIF